ncbi:C40 family peptidase [Herbaspirillum autotrophicum]|uniref:C40 family peptidase n=1 Tax=Herbaspirillum autotrophicum TaxID=180195 RepID=UPI00067E4419|nr:C40 family peptidase [Herbaspirillum autotrophicum]
MHPATEEAIRAHAIAEYPRECCGLVIIEHGVETYVPCRNAADPEDKNAHFVLPADEYACAEDKGQIVALVHSHTDEPARPSEGDKVACEASALIWHIIRVDGGPDGPVATELVTHAPCGYQAPLVGRGFFHGVLDCYSLIRDWYQRERGITLKDFARRDGWWRDGSGDDLYMTQFRVAGFVAVDASDIQIGDVIIMQYGARVANHAGVYIGNSEFLHHLYNKLSTRDVYGGHWREITRLIVRYRPA